MVRKLVTSCSLTKGNRSMPLSSAPTKPLTMPTSYASSKATQSPSWDKAEGAERLDGDGVVGFN